VRLTPKETLALGGRCPVCGRPVTVGVAHRIEALADRDGPGVVETDGAVESLVPLPEILSEIAGVGPGSKAVAAAYADTLAALGPELDLLGEMPVEDVARSSPLLGEAVSRLRQGRVIRNPGYDGEYGTIRLFDAGELPGRASRRRP
jgi:PHP family Zn ribbon phosphoesterase